jgi:hypothetical protein
LTNNYQQCWTVQFVQYGKNITTFKGNVHQEVSFESMRVESFSEICLLRILRESCKVCQQQRNEGKEGSGRDGWEKEKGEGKREGEGKDTYKDREKERVGEREEKDAVRRGKGSRNSPPVSVSFIPVANCHRCRSYRWLFGTGVIDTGGKFATR